MYINVANATRHADRLIDFATSRRFGFSTWDQGALEKHFGGTTAHPWDWLDDSVINARGFLPVHQFMDRATGQSRAAIWHWHGYKANQMQCLFRSIKAGTWNVSGAIDLRSDPEGARPLQSPHLPSKATHALSHDDPPRPQAAVRRGRTQNSRTCRCPAARS
jgi:hypothetical protein